jgi:hypothetical protein
MTVHIGAFEFDGPGLKIEELEDEPGIYALLHYYDNSYELIDLDQCVSLQLWARSTDFDGLKQKYLGFMSLAVRYTPGLSRAARLSIVEEIMQDVKDQRLLNFV